MANPANDKHIATRRERRRVSVLPRVANCGRHLIPNHGRGTGQASVWVAPGGSAGPTVSIRGLQRCGSVWSCPECAAIVARGRIQEIVAGMKRAVEQVDPLNPDVRMSWGGCWQTLTLPHDAPDRLADTLAMVAEGWRHIRQGRGWRAIARQLDVRGTIRKVEVTHGDNGWHPHCHLTFLTGRELTEEELEQLEFYVWNAWTEYVTARGYRPPLRSLCPMAGLRLDSLDWAEYVGKALGWELAGTQKESRQVNGRMPFEILAAACLAVRDHRGDGEPRELDGQVCRDLRLWREYERATRGRRQLVWSQGLKAALGVQDVTDEEQLTLAEIAGQDEECVAQLTPHEWRAIYRTTGALEALHQLAVQPAPLAERRADIRYWVREWVGHFEKWLAGRVKS